MLPTPEFFIALVTLACIFVALVAAIKDECRRKRNGRSR